MTQDEVDERRRFVKTSCTYLNGLTPKVLRSEYYTRVVGPVALFEYAKKRQSNPKPSWLCDDRTEMLSHFKDDLYRLRHPEKFLLAPHRSRNPDSADDLQRRRLSQLEAHSKELAKAFGEPEVLLGDGFSDVKVDADQVEYARQHLEAYPKIKMAKADLRAKENDRDKLAGKPPSIWLRGVGTGPTGGTARDLLLAEVRKITAKLYPAFPEYDRKGNPSSRCILIDCIVEDLWAGVEFSELHSTLRGYKLTLEPVNDHWRVCRPSGQGFVMVPSKDLTRADQLDELLGGLASSPELHQVYREVQDAREVAGTARATYLAMVKELGTKLRLGELVGGTCKLGY